MNDTFFNLLQLLGGFILAAGYIPQIRQLIRTRSAKDLSFKTFLFLTIGIGCMEIYAIHLAIGGTGFAFLVTNSLSLGISLLLCILIAVYQQKTDKKIIPEWNGGVHKHLAVTFSKNGGKRMKPLTDYERQFADQHHEIVYRFLRSRGLNISEYYDVVIFRYLGAVQRYLSEPELQQYSFETIARAAMRSALGYHFQAEKRKQEFCITDTSFVETLVGYMPDEKQNDVAKLLWLEVASLLTESEKTLVNQRAHGWSYKEIAEDYGLKEGTISSRMSKLRKRICNLCDIDAMLAQIIG